MTSTTIQMRMKEEDFDAYMFGVLFKMNNKYDDQAMRESDEWKDVCNYDLEACIRDNSAAENYKDFLSILKDQQTFLREELKPDADKINKLKKMCAKFSPGKWEDEAGSYSCWEHIIEEVEAMVKGVEEKIVDLSMYLIKYETANRTLRKAKVKIASLNVFRT